MAIRFDCPSCKSNYEVADDLGGKMIMCRVCQKRGSVPKATATALSTATLPSAGKSSAASRRNFLLIGGSILASLGAIATGALLARRPWRHWGEPPPPEGPPWRRPPPGKDSPESKAKS